MTRVLERGDVFFAYRPRVGEPEAHALVDVQRLWMFLSPHGRPLHRRIVIGKKRLPATGRHQRHWAYVDRVDSRPARLIDDLHETYYQTRTRGLRHQHAARAAGEGVYAIVEHGDHAHLAYRLELPADPGDVQHALGIADEASYIAAVFNPNAPPRGTVDRQFRRRKADVHPPALDARFRGRRFAMLEPGFLDHVGAELVLIGASDDIAGDLGIALDVDPGGRAKPARLHPGREVADALDLSHSLGEEEGEHPFRPLFEGLWA